MRRLGLGAKFSLTVLVILTVTMAANTLYSLRTSARFHEQELEERGRALGRLIALVSPEAILANDFLLLNEYTRQVSLQPDVVFSVIVNARGTPLSAYFDDPQGRVRKGLQAAGPDETLDALQHLSRNAELIQIEFPITHNEGVLGHFRLALSRQALENQFRRQLTVQITLFAVLVIFLGGAIYAVFRYNVLYPIRRLIAASTQLGRGQYPVVKVHADDELGRLARAFNHMAEEVREEQAKLHRQANFDALTGLPNRMMALDRMGQEVQRARRSGQRFAVLFIDLDDFKTVNDSLGHAVGDQLLVMIGARVQASLREGDTVARLGGDEFLVLLPDIAGEVQVERIAERLLQAVAQPQELGGRKVVSHCSIGIALYPDNGDSVQALMANADNAMYQAKAAERGSVIFFTEEMNTRLRERVQMEQDLELAIERGELALHFQPIVELSGRRNLGAEVLLRWTHPEKGAISPAQFVPLAEASGQIVRIGDWVLEQACRALAAWRRDGLQPGFLAINVSRVQFRRRFSRRLAELMSAHGLPPHAIELELTEGVLLDDQRQVAEELASLRAAGVRLALDDFGTGYSSLSYLKRFRFEVLKIDRSFVAGLPGNADDVSLVKAILAMAHGLDLRVLAEGVETREQLAFLAAHGCEFAQGFFIARPMDEAGYRRYLQEQRQPEQPWNASRAYSQ